MTTDMDPQALELTIRLMQQNAKDAAFTTQALLEGYQRDYKVAQATVVAIRYSICKLFEKGYQPSENAIMRALYPDTELIEEIMNHD